MPLASLLVDTTASALDGIRSLSLNPIAALMRLQGRADERRRLAELDDRLLADIGLDRVTAQAEADKPVWKA
ncbi:DUF1127 domain-containing protein [Rhodospirillaceae bacterium KN72]|uniref:DUF1127 domain-containing protein n=2 Tax=Pacificispira spongiicola TaxID=2729598 RepID=A0A7Y0E131_9PROT|nr:DUF1127 domain-containing protein [Pacificispira spongiicola]